MSLYRLHKSAGLMGKKIRQVINPDLAKGEGTMGNEVGAGADERI